MLKRRSYQDKKTPVHIEEKLALVRRITNLQEVYYESSPMGEFHLLNWFKEVTKKGWKVTPDQSINPIMMITNVDSANPRGRSNVLGDFHLADELSTLTERKKLTTAPIEKLFRLSTPHGDIAIFYLMSMSHGIRSFLFMLGKNKSEILKIWNIFIGYAENAERSGEYLIRWNSGSRDIRPNTSWDDIILDEKIKKEITESVDSFFNKKEAYYKYGITYKRGLLFVGPPGNGKTMVCKAIINKLKAPVIILEADDDIDDRTFQACYEYASKIAPCMVVVEDLDRLSNDSHCITLAAILNTIDGISSKEGILTIATSNNPQDIDPALIDRPSRFDKIWLFDLPDYYARCKMYQKMGSKYWSKEVLKQAAEKAEELSMAYVKESIASIFISAVQQDKDPSDFNLLEEIDRLNERKEAIKKGYASAMQGKVGFR